MLVQELDAIVAAADDRTALRHSMRSSLSTTMRWSSSLYRTDRYRGLSPEGTRRQLLQSPPLGRSSSAADSSLLGHSNAVNSSSQCQQHGGELQLRGAAAGECSELVVSTCFSETTTTEITETCEARETVERREQRVHTTLSSGASFSSTSSSTSSSSSSSLCDLNRRCPDSCKADDKDGSHHLLSSRSDEKKSQRFRLYTVDEIPEFLKDNEFILGGYRVGYSFVDCLISIFRLHNETGNIWTHLIGAFIIVYLMVFSSLGGIPEEASLADRGMVFLFLAAALKCLLSSSLFHAVFCHSEHTFGWSGCLDYMGISVSICAAFLTITYFLFYGDAVKFSLYAVAIVLTSSIGIIGPMFPVWATPFFRPWRTLVYILSSTVSALPIFHFFLTEDLHAVASHLGFWGKEGWLIIIAVYILGAAIYVGRLPERFFPGKCDIFIQSHQIWHAAVVVGMYLQHFALVELLKWRLNSPSSA